MNRWSCLTIWSSLLAWLLFAVTLRRAKRANVFNQRFDLRRFHRVFETGHDAFAFTDYFDDLLVRSFGLPLRAGHIGRFQTWNAFAVRRVALLALLFVDRGGVHRFASNLRDRFALSALR